MKFCVDCKHCLPIKSDDAINGIDHLCQHPAEQEAVSLVDGKTRARPSPLRCASARFYGECGRTASLWSAK